jgi:hypothetical protein
VNATPATRGSATSRCTDDRAIARQELQHVVGDPGLVQQSYALRRHERRLFRGFGDDGVAGPPAPAPIWPVKIASGKFHGLTARRITPRPCSVSSLLSPGRPGQPQPVAELGRARAA